MARTFGYNFGGVIKKLIAITVAAAVIGVFDWPGSADLFLWLVFAGYAVYSLLLELYPISRVTVDDTSVCIESLLPWRPSLTIQFADVVDFSALRLFDNPPVSCTISTCRAKSATIAEMGTKDFHELYELLDGALSERLKGAPSEPPDVYD